MPWTFFESVILRRFKEFLGLQDDRKIIWKIFTPGHYPVQKIFIFKKRPLCKKTLDTYACMYTVTACTLKICRGNATCIEENEYDAVFYPDYFFVLNMRVVIKLIWKLGTFFSQNNIFYCIFLSYVSSGILPKIFLGLYIKKFQAVVFSY